MAIRNFSKLSLAHAEVLQLAKIAWNCADSCQPMTRIVCKITVGEIVANGNKCILFNPAKSYKQVSPAALSTGYYLPLAETLW